MRNRRSDDRPDRVWIMAVLVLLLFAFLVGTCSGPVLVDGATKEANAGPAARPLPDGIETFHDASNEVTCWRQKGNYGAWISVSCLPDAWLAGARSAGGE